MVLTPPTTKITSKTETVRLKGRRSAACILSARLPRTLKTFSSKKCMGMFSKKASASPIKSG